MMNLASLGTDDRIINEIDWEMTPEDAVTLYLEWGNNPALGRNIVRSKNDYSTYFVINTWYEPIIYLIRRNSEGAEEIAEITIPEPLKERYMQDNGNLRGVYALEGEIKEWLQRELLHTTIH